MRRTVGAASREREQDDSDESGDESESSDEETLAQLKTRASRSTLNLARPPFQATVSPMIGNARLTSPSMDNLSLGRKTSRMSTSSSTTRISSSPYQSFSHDSTGPGLTRPALPKQNSTSPGKSSLSGSSLPHSPSGKSVSILDPRDRNTYPAPGAPPSARRQSFYAAAASATTNATAQIGMHTSSSSMSMAASLDAKASASPASSQSGLTGDSAQGPVTPREGSVASVQRSKGGVSPPVI